MAVAPAGQVPGRHCAAHRQATDSAGLYAQRFSLRTLVESGTYLGNMVYEMRNDFDRIYSMELDEALFKRAQQLFGRETNVHIIHGDSGSLLPAIVRQLEEPDFRASLYGCAEVIVTRAGGHADGHDPGGRDRDARFCDRLASMAKQAGAGGAFQEL